MTNFIKLVIINIKTSFNIYKFKDAKILKKIAFSILALYILASIITSVLVYTSLAYDYLDKYHLLFVMMPAFAFLISFLTLSFSIFNAKNLLFGAKDNNLMLSLPIKERTVYIARWFTLYGLNLAVILPLFLIAGIYYGTNMHLAINYYLILILVGFLLPIIPTIIIAIFGYAMTWISNHFRNKNIAEIFFSLIFIIAFVLLTGNIKNIMDQLIIHQETIIKIIKYAFYPIYLLYYVFNDYDLAKLGYFILINLVILIIFNFLLGSRYYDLLSKIDHTQKNKSKKETVMKKRTLNQTLLFKEFKRYISSPIYVLNTSFGVILILLMALATFFYDMDTIIKTMDLSELNLSMNWLILALVLFVSTLSSTTCSSISMEGNSLWIVQSLPIKLSRIFASKVLLNLLVVVPATVMSLIILGVNLKLSITLIILLVITNVIVTLLVAVFGLFINLLFPLMNATNDVQVVKQSASSLISILVPLMIIILLMAFVPKTNFNIYLFMIILNLISIGLIIAINQLLRTVGQRRFHQLG